MSYSTKRECTREKIAIAFQVLGETYSLLGPWEINFCEGIYEFSEMVYSLLAYELIS